MKYLIAVIAAAFVLSSAPLNAGISKTDLSKGVVLTEEATLLTQVDAVSLHLSSENIKFAPRLTESGLIDVETTVLSKKLLQDKEKLNSFLDRNVKTFIALLKDRLPIYAPSIAKNFNPNSQIKFNVNSGAKRDPVAAWSGGTWSWDKGFSPAPSVVESSTFAAQSAEAYAPAAEEKPKGKGKLSCDCPARRK